jgi:hypothetical protein
MGTVYTPNSNQGKQRCEICGKIFETPEMLSYHKILEHGPDKRDPSGLS